MVHLATLNSSNHRASRSEIERFCMAQRLSSLVHPSPSSLATVHRNCTIIWDRPQILVGKVFFSHVVLDFTAVSPADAADSLLCPNWKRLQMVGVGLSTDAPMCSRKKIHPFLSPRVLGRTGLPPPTFWTFAFFLLILLEPSAWT